MYNFLAKKKHTGSCPSNQVSAATMTSASDEKWRPFLCFSVQGTDGSATGADPENRVVDKDTGSPVGQFLLGCKCPVSWGIVGQEPDHFGDLSEVFFFQNVLQLPQQRREELVDWPFGR